MSPSHRWNWIGTMTSTFVAVALASAAAASTATQSQSVAQSAPAEQPVKPAAPAAADRPVVKPGTPTSAPTSAKENSGGTRRVARPGDSTASTAETLNQDLAQDQGVPVNAPAGTAIPNEPPVIEFDPPIADMGEMIADVAKTVVVKIKNISDKPVRITKAIPGCGCTTPTWPKDPIPPGGSGDCEITLRPGSKQGIKLSKKVTFQLENHAPATLTVEGNVVAYVTMVPDMLDSPSDAASGSAKPSDVTFESTDGTAFKIVEVVPPVVKNLPIDAKTKHVLSIDWGTWSESGSQPKIMFKTDHPKAAALTMLVKRAFNAPGADAPNAPRTPPAGPGTTALINAVRAGDLAKISSELAAGADVNERDRTGQRTALHWAAKGGNRAAMEKLFEAKADPNVKDRQGRSPLWGAVETDVETVKFLVDKGADINARDQINSSPLLWAAGFGKPETVGFLITKGADVKATDDNGWTPLIWAAGLGQPQTVELLVKAGADLKAADKQTGDTPLLRGARTGKVESLKILIDAGADIGAKNKLGQTALHLAAASGSADKVAILLAAKADPAALDDKGWAPIDHAMNRTTGDKTKLLEILKPVSPEPKAAAPASN